MTNTILFNPEKHILYIGSQDKTIKMYKILNYKEYEHNNNAQLIFKNLGALKGHNREITLIKIIYSQLLVDTKKL